MKLGMKKLTAYIGALAIAILAPLAHAKDSVTNRGFESGDADWSVTGNANAGNTITPLDGALSMEFLAVDGNLSGTIHQDLDLANPFGYTIDFFLSGGTIGFSFGSLNFSDLDLVDTTVVDGNDWVHYQGKIGNVGAATLAFSFSPSSAASRFLDDVSVAANACTANCGGNVPEPGTLLLVGAALAAAATVRRRKQNRI